MRLHPCASLDNEKICYEISNIKYQFVRKLWFSRAGTLEIKFKFDLACLIESVFQFSDTHNETDGL